MDALSEILKSIKAHYSRAGIIRLSEPWGLFADIQATVAYAAAAGGPCWVRLRERAEAIRFDVGDIVLINGPHTLLSSPGVAEVDLIDILRERELTTDPRLSPAIEPDSPRHFDWGGGGRETRMLGLVFSVPGRPGNSLLQALPRLLVLPGGSGGVPWVAAAIEFLTSEHSHSPGYTAIERSLSELVLTSIVRSHLLSGADVETGWLRGLSDPGVGRALQAIHARPEQAWTVHTLAVAAGRSRTSFATRFSELVGVTPIKYLMQWRMHLAADQILSSRTNLSKLAVDLGYASDAAFRNAFKRCHGIAPSRFRDMHAAGFEG